MITTSIVLKATGFGPSLHDTYRIKVSVAVTERATSKPPCRYLEYYWTDGLAAYYIIADNIDRW